MTTCRKVGLVLVVLFSVLVRATDSSGNESKSDSASSSNLTVVAALQAEAEGDLDRREKLLASLSTSDTSSSQSLRGKLQVRQGEWKSIDESIEDSNKNKKLVQYDLVRQRYADTAANHVELAKWCKAAKLPEQGRAHLIRALRIDPENHDAHQALGNRKSGYDWISPKQIREAEDREKRTNSSLKEFGFAMRTIARDLGSNNNAIAAKAEQRFAKIRDSRSIPAMGASFSNASFRAIESGVDWLGTHTHPDAGQTLMHFAIFHESEFVRELASQQLVKRDPYEFVPSLIELVTSPVHSTLEPVFDRTGLLRGFQHAFSREGVEQDQYLVMQTSIQGVRRGPRGSGTDTAIQGVRLSNAASIPEPAREAIERAQDAATKREGRVASRNQQTQKINLRVAALVSKIAGRNVSSYPRELWGWWYEHNERERPQARTARYVRLYDESNYDIESSPTRAMSGECFVKGTPVTTQNGLKPIEKIVTGDLVLSKDIRTGELAWKPVIEPTRRPATSLLTIRAGCDELKCTPGHVFWVSGHGWRKASELIPGNILHAAKVPVAIDQIAETEAAETYNLIVSENSNYFVGKQMIFSHDYTSRSYAPQVVPGYSPNTTAQ